RAIHAPLFVGLLRIAEPATQLRLEALPPTLAFEDPVFGPEPRRVDGFVAGLLDGRAVVARGIARRREQRAHRRAYFVHGIARRGAQGSREVGQFANDIGLAAIVRWVRVQT